jgi:hypothetical protein
MSTNSAFTKVSEGVYTLPRSHAIPFVGTDRQTSVIWSPTGLRWTKLGSDRTYMITRADNHATTLGPEQPDRSYASAGHPIESNYVPLQGPNAGEAFTVVINNEDEYFNGPPTANGYH